MAATRRGARGLRTCLPISASSTPDASRRQLSCLQLVVDGDLDIVQSLHAHRRASDLDQEGAPARSLLMTPTVPREGVTVRCSARRTSKMALRECRSWALAVSLGVAVLAISLTTYGQTSGQASADSAPPAATSEAPSAPQHRLKWRFHRFTAPEYVLTGVAAAGYLYLEFLTKTPADPNWRGGILIDDSVRDALVAKSRAGRDRAATWSDVTALVPQLWAVFDGAIIPVATDRGNWDVAWQMTIMNVQGIALAGLLARSGHRFVARERPDVAPCIADPQYDSHCFGGSNASFPAGHTASSMEGAGLTCAHHLHLPLYGSSAVDVAACGTATALAVTNGWLRIVADRHYFSDVVVGASVGAATGFVLPMLVNYRTVDDTPAPAVSFTLAPFVSSYTMGLAADGLF